MDKSLSADDRVDLLVKALTLDEKIGLVNGGRAGYGVAVTATPTRSLGGAGYIPGVERLGIPALQMADSAVGVVRSARYGQVLRYGTPKNS